MIVFHPGTGPDSEAIGIALEEGFLDYRIAPSEPAPAIVDGSVRIEGMEAILLFLAGRCGRFLPEKRGKEAAEWLALAAAGMFDPAKLDRALANTRYILGEFSIADMAVCPLLLRQGLANSRANIARWAQRMGRRSATGRGMGARLLAPS